MSDPILFDIQDQIAYVTLNNPEKRNALTKPAWIMLDQIFEKLSANLDLRCVVVRGMGREAFAAGADIFEFPTERSNSDQARAYEKIVQKTIHAIHICPHPVVAMIHGACTGGGLEIAAACDLRLAGKNARFGVPINRLGHTLAYPLMEDIMMLVGPAVMSELLLEGQVMDSAYALRTGMVNRVVEDDLLEEEVTKCITKIAKGAPLAARLHKKMIRNMKTGRTLKPAEKDEPFLVCDSQDYQNGFRAFMNKQKPHFEGK